VSIAGGGGVSLFNSMGDAWTANYLKITGDLAVDLHSNIAAEARAKIVYERLINFTDDPGSKQALQFLMTREITHMRAFTAALETMGKPKFAIGTIAPTPGLVDEFFKDSTDGAAGKEGSAAEIVQSAGLKTVESPILGGGKGLHTKPTMPEPDSEETSPADSTPVGATRQPPRSHRTQPKTGTR
jgi:Mn-containing catalase